MWNRRRIVRLRGICALAAAALLCGCAGQEEPDDIVGIETDEEGISYEFGEAQVTDVVCTQRVTCKFRQMDEQEVSFPMGGRRVDRLYVAEGDKVKKGQLLAELSSLELERRIEDLEYGIQRNQLRLEYLDANEDIAVSSLWVDYLYGSGQGAGKEALDQRVEQLKEGNRYTREDLSDTIEMDRKELEELKQELASSRVYAGMDGVIYDLKENLVGSTSQMGEVIMTVMDTSVSLYEAQAPALAGYFKEGEPVSMTISFGDGAGNYLLLPWKMDQWGDTQIFEVSEGPEQAATEVGTSGIITVVTDSRQNVLAVPTAAVKNAGEKHYVYVLGEDEVREMRWVETGLFGDSLVEILDGLEEGEKVILK